MVKILQNHLKKLRLEKGLNSHQLAKLIGYKNLNKGGRKIIQMERGESWPDKELIKKIVKALQIEREELDQVISRHKVREKEVYLKEKKEFEKWQQEPAANKLYYSPIPAIVVSKKIPEDIKDEEALIKYAAGFKFRLCWLFLGRKEKIFMERGRINYRKKITYENNCAFYTVKIGNKDATSLFTFEEGG